MWKSCFVPKSRQLAPDVRDQVRLITVGHGVVAADCGLITADYGVVDKDRRRTNDPQSTVAIQVLLNSIRLNQLSVNQSISDDELSLDTSKLTVDDEEPDR